MLGDFYKKSPKEIVRLVDDFLYQDFFPIFQKWKGKASFIIVGSVAYGLYDEYSDIDLKILVPKRFVAIYSKEEIKKYKRHLRSLKVPIQLHTPETFEHLVECLSDWSRDWLNRDVAQALIVEDTEGKFKSIQKRFRAYPSMIRREKLNWLIAEAVFHLKERLDIALKRNDSFFIEVTKLKVVRLLLNAYLIGAQKFPSFDKHLYAEVKMLPHSEQIIGLVNEILCEHKPDRIHKSLNELRQIVEQQLTKRKLLKERSDQEWIDLRPKHRVELEI